jgi:gliding motility-associated-like protein
VIQDFSNGRPELSSPPDLILDTKSIRAHARSDWEHVRTCYVASGGEQFIAIALPFGNFGELPACLMMDNDATFYTFYFDIDEISITPLELELNSSISKCNDESLDLKEIGVPEIYGSQIIWEDGDTNFVRSDFPFGEVDLSLLLPCEEIEFKLNIIEKNCELQFYIPNAFSPNGDLLHDLLLPVFGNDVLITNYKFQIFDRWGSIVYDGDASDSGWDGTFQGQVAKTGTYAWVMEIFLPQKDPEVFYGSVHVFK